MRHTVPALALLLVLGLADGVEARDRIRIVGSSTVFPFSTAAAEEFGWTKGLRTPVVESTGTGGGLKLFCAGVGIRHPDIANASRRITESERELCARNGVGEVTEVRLGFDGIVVANSLAGAPMDLNLRDLFLALAKEVPDGTGEPVPNPHRTWRNVNPALPDRRIAVYGPPPTSGTRDAFVELALEGGCRTLPALALLKETDEARFRAACQTIREDGSFIEAGENDNLIVQKLVADPDAFGVFGFSFLDQNVDKIRGSHIDGVEPTFENIAEGRYPVSRSLYVYVKDAHVGVIQGIPAFLAELTSERAIAPDGYLAEKGLIPLPEAERERVRKGLAAAFPARP